MMSEFSFDRSSDWDLQAIVKGRSLTNNSNTTMINNVPYYSHDSTWFDTLGINGYQGYENTTFISNNEPLTLGSSTSSPQEMVVESSINEPKHKTPANDALNVNTRAAIISKRRKNKHKIIKMIQQEGSDRVVCDKWNWRKYGEKVIKGSPYPRSYYRCSYSGGCSARKQVEQSSNNPDLFLITYMEEHTHPYPTRRHSQAGRSAKRFNHSSSIKVNITNQSQTSSMRTITSESSTNNNYGNLAMQGYEDDVGSVDCVGENQGLCFGNSVFEGDFFEGLDYLEGLM